MRYIVRSYREKARIASPYINITRGNGVCGLRNENAKRTAGSVAGGVKNDRVKLS